MNVMNHGNNYQYIQIIYVRGIFTQGNQYISRLFMLSLKYMVEYYSHNNCYLNWTVFTKKLSNCVVTISSCSNMDHKFLQTRSFFLHVKAFALDKKGKVIIFSK